MRYEYLRDQICAVCGLPYSDHSEAFGLPPGRVNNCAQIHEEEPETCGMCKDGKCYPKHGFTPVDTTSAPSKSAETARLDQLEAMRHSVLCMLVEGPDALAEAGTGRGGLRAAVDCAVQEVVRTRPGHVPEEPRAPSPVFFSERGFALFSPRRELWTWEDMPDEAHLAPVLTVENYTKWYVLYLVHPDNRVEQVSFDQLNDFTDKSPYTDHAPNPVAVERLAAARGWNIAERAMECIIGRWISTRGWTATEIER